MSSTNLDVLVRAATTLLVLSLATERIAEMFKRRDWQPLYAFGAFLRKHVFRDADRPRVSLRTGALPRGAAEAASVDPVAARQLERRVTRSAHAENTVLIGATLAALSGANAFAAFMDPPRSGGSVVWGSIQTWVQILLSGAAAGLGSSFWYDMVRLLSEARRVRETLADASQVPAIVVPPYLQSGTVKAPPATTT
jgi:hypothetical protein